MKSKLCALILAGAALVGVPGMAEANLEFAKVGTFGGQFLKIGPTARAVGMGQAFTAVAEGSEAVYWNPAGITNIRGQHLTVGQTEWPADINLSYFALVFNPRSIPGTFALSGRALWMDPQIVRTAFEPDGTGQTFDSGMSTLGLTYARFFTDKFSAGATLSFMHSGLAETSVNTAVADVGILYRIGLRGMKIGMSIQSLGAEVTYDQQSARMPTTFKVGFAFTPIESQNTRLIASSEFQHPVDNAERANFGLEYGLQDRFFLRGGYNLNYDLESISAGAGFRIDTGTRSYVDLDYGWVDMDALGNVHRVTVSFAY